MNEEKIYGKLIRDLIPKIIVNNGKIPITHVADDAEFEERLYEKVLEELDEFKASKSIEEIADILEVLDAIMEFYNFSKKEVEEVKRKKANDKGMFKKRIILDKIVIK
ncbi:MAG: nucleoside triphosphate pyrophosphohydrolase [Promethearchaeota archaeon]